MKLKFIFCSCIGLAACTASAQENSFFGSGAPPIDQGRVVAHSIQIVSSEFVADVYLDGKLVPAKQHTLEKEIFGAQIERVSMEIHEGDWIVFQVVNNELRGGFPRYFAAAGMADDKHAAFVSETASGQWLACDNLREVARFVAERDFQGDGKARKVTEHWGDGDSQINEKVPGWNGEPVWGASHAPWIKFIVPHQKPGQLPAGAPAAEAAPSAPATDATATEAVLTCAPWKLTMSKGWSVIRVFNKDGSFSTRNMPGQSGYWKISGNTLVQTYADGRQDTLTLPLNLKATPGTAADGQTVTAVLDSSAASAPLPFPTPGAEMTADEKDVCMAMLIAEHWRVTGKDGAWVNVRIFDKNGTFTTVDQAGLHGHWKISKNQLILTFADGQKDTIALPFTARASTGVDQNGDPTTVTIDTPEKK